MEVWRQALVENAKAVKVGGESYAVGSSIGLRIWTRSEMGNYKVYVALDAEKNEGWVWLPFDAGLSAEFVTIQNATNSWKIVCERRTVDENFRNVYKATGSTIELPENGRFMVMNAWYRQRLGIFDTKGEVSLEVNNSTGWLAMYHASRQHPNPAIRMSMFIATLSVFLGLVGVVEGVIALCR